MRDVNTLESRMTNEAHANPALAGGGGAVVCGAWHETRNMQIRLLAVVLYAWLGPCAQHNGSLGVAQAIPIGNSAQIQIK